MIAGKAPARDLGLLDALDARARKPFEGSVWRVCRTERDPITGFASLTRWCDGTFEVLYTACEKDGAIAEIYFHLSRQPVFPSRVSYGAHRLTVRTETTLDLSQLDGLAELGVDVPRYRELDYDKTRAIAEAAHFLGFDSLLVPSARFACSNLVLFTDRLTPEAVDIAESDAGPIDFAAWRRERRG